MYIYISWPWLTPHQGYIYIQLLLSKRKKFSSKLVLYIYLRTLFNTT